VTPSSAAADPAPAAAGPAGSLFAPNIAAALASFFVLLGGIVFLAIEKKDQFVRFYAMQSVFLGAAWVVFSFGFGFVAVLMRDIPLIGWLISLVNVVVRLAVLAVWVMTVWKAYSNKEWEIPYLGKMARQQLAKTPAAP
jgi:uncharacterized membrane protein